MTLQDAKNEVAKKHGFNSWMDYLHKEQIGSIVDGVEFVNPFSGKSNKKELHYTAMNAEAAILYGSYKEWAGFNAGRESKDLGGVNISAFLKYKTFEEYKNRSNETNF